MQDKEVEAVVLGNRYYHFKKTKNNLFNALASNRYIFLLIHATTMY